MQPQMRVYLLTLLDLSAPAICIVPKLFQVSGQLVSALAGRLQLAEKRIALLQSNSLEAVRKAVDDYQVTVL
jgi:hypothetical protein